VTHQALIGLMSGTSLDGVDGVVAALTADGQWVGVLAHAHEPFPAALRDELLALNTSGPDELHRAAMAGQEVARAYARITQRLRAATGHVPVLAMGAHGQTVRHRPELGYTSQLLAPALLAELTGLDVVADFRSRDVAAGGQGAPLVPVFHQAVFARPDADVAVLNVGGMANVSLLRPGLSPLGFDCGPGNVLMDLWCQQQLGQPFDADGQWAASGQVQAEWLALALAEPYFSMPAPKSTGRDLFHAPWLRGWLDACGVPAHPSAAVAAHVQATLCELTARSCVDALRDQRDALAELLVCGGGALNGQLMSRLQILLNGVPVLSTADRGLPPMEVEAAAFAWLAWACLNRHPGNVPEVTGAQGPRVLGAIYPA
jgi:anhydro-N-acetylmuramic acid kinase